MIREWCFNELNIAIGDEMNEDRAIEVIKDLFETGYFRAVDVLRDGDVLVIEVEENPTIAEVEFSGISELSDTVLEGMLQSAGIVKARVFDRALMGGDGFLRWKIFTRSATITKLKSIRSCRRCPRNRVALLFEVEEGNQAAIRSIEISGNEEFSDWALRREMNLEPRGLFNFFGDSYLFSESRLDADLERISHALF